MKVPIFIFLVGWKNIFFFIQKKKNIAQNLILIQGYSIIVIN